MKLSTVVAAFVQAQNNFDHNAYANCFDQAAIVHDEGHTHHGRTEIMEWIGQANIKYKSRMEPLSFSQTRSEAVIKARVSGTFDGGPAVLKFYLKLENDYTVIKT